jgi:hypothetical protein
MERMDSTLHIGQDTEGSGYGHYPGICLKRLRETKRNFSQGFRKGMETSG